MAMKATLMKYAASPNPSLSTSSRPAKLRTSPSAHIASDDCAGGTGNGPAYVRGPVQVVGKDRYKLDSNGDGVGCET